MPLRTECPRCPTPLGAVTPALAPDLAGTDAICPEHGPTPVLRRPDAASYDGFAEALSTAGEFPTYLPWPMSPGWSVSDFAVVGGAVGGAAGGAVGGGLGAATGPEAKATMTCSSGTSALDGPVDVFVISEESGTGLGARCAGTQHLDPGPEMGVGSPMVRVRIGSQSVPLWSVSTASSDRELDRSVVAGEAHGRWLWIVLRPASAMFLLRDEWILRDVSGIGPPLVEMPFGGPAPTW